MFSDQISHLRGSLAVATPLAASSAAAAIKLTTHATSVISAGEVFNGITKRSTLLVSPSFLSQLRRSCNYNDFTVLEMIIKGVTSFRREDHNHLPAYCIQRRKRISPVVPAVQISRGMGDEHHLATGCKSHAVARSPQGRPRAPNLLWQSRSHCCSADTEKKDRHHIAVGPPVT